MRETYRTRQQEELRRILEQTPGVHYTAAQIHELMVQQGQAIGLATIYRHLDRMVTDGVVRKYQLETNDGACYEYVGHHDECCTHFHCKCEQCGRLIHLDCDELRSIQEHIREHHGFTWNTGKTVFYGICDQCRQA